MGDFAHIPIKGALRSNSIHENNTIYNVSPTSPTAPKGGIEGGEGGINIYELFIRERVKWVSTEKSPLFSLLCCFPIFSSGR
jgi:hypothetical protein